MTSKPAGGHISNITLSCTSKAQARPWPVGYTLTGLQRHCKSTINIIACSTPPTMRQLQLHSTWVEARRLRQHPAPSTQHPEAANLSLHQQHPTSGHIEAHVCDSATTALQPGLQGLAGVGRGRQTLAGLRLAGAQPAARLAQPNLGGTADSNPSGATSPVVL